MVQQQVEEEEEEVVLVQEAVALAVAGEMRMVLEALRCGAVPNVTR